MGRAARGQPPTEPREQSRLLTALLAVAIVVLGVRWLGPTEPAPPPPAPQRLAAPAQCQTGVPARMRIPDLDVDAEVERIGLDLEVPAAADGSRPLGNPVDRDNIGWYAPGPKPGSGRGTVITDGHTYRDGSAVFREDFDDRMRPGIDIEVVTTKGAVCRYRVSKVWRTLDARSEYPQLVTRQSLYRSTGPERLLIVTCGGRWDEGRQEYADVNVVVAAPVTRQGQAPPRAG